MNEITAISETVGDQWKDPAHDANGNMTTIPQPKDLTKGYTATWDAWNRLVKLTNDADSDKTVAEFEYDGLNRRTIKKPYTNGSLDETRHFYYSNQWQVLEERVDIATTADKQYVWGMRYVDDLVLRDKGSERLYALQDALFNVVALADNTGAVKERFTYQPYGESQVLTPAFADRASTEYNWETRFTGRGLDLDTGLQLNRNRYYHNQLGRWLTRDPIGYGDGLNLYGYVKQIPTDLVDPSGSSSLKPYPKHSFPYDLFVLKQHEIPEDCGEFHVYLKFALAVAGKKPVRQFALNHAGGYIVQEILYQVNATDCDGNVLGEKDLRRPEDSAWNIENGYRFWEAFKLGQGSRTPDGFKPVPGKKSLYNDHWSYSGEVVQVSRAR